MEKNITIYELKLKLNKRFQESVRLERPEITEGALGGLSKMFDKYVDRIVDKVKAKKLERGTPESNELKAELEREKARIDDLIGELESL